MDMHAGLGRSLPTEPCAPQTGLSPLPAPPGYDIQLGQQRDSSLKSTRHWLGMRADFLTSLSPNLGPIAGARAQLPPGDLCEES